MPDLRSFRFARPSTRNGPAFSHSRDRSERNPKHSLEQNLIGHSAIDSDGGSYGESTGGLENEEPGPEVPRCISAGFSPSEGSLGEEPQWALADGHRSYRAVPTPDLALIADSLRHESWATDSVRPDLGAAGPQGDPGDEDGDDEDDDGAYPVDDAIGDLAPWPIETPDDAIDTFELHRAVTFQSGLAVLVLDNDRVPFLHVALQGNPVDDIHCALSLFCPSLPNGRIPAGLIFGIVRPQHRQAPQSVLDAGVPFAEPSIWVDPVESAAWREAAWALHDEGIKLHDVIVIEPDRWMSLARSAGLITYATNQYA
jgi:hypothetical protein